MEAEASGKVWEISSDSKNFRKPVGKGYVKDSKGNLVKDGNGNPVRGGNVYDPRDLNPGRSY